MHLDAKSKQRLLQVHPDLRKVFVELANDPSAEVVIGGEWRVTSGLRTLAEQRQLILKGASRATSKAMPSIWPSSWTARRCGTCRGTPG